MTFISPLAPLSFPDTAFIKNNDVGKMAELARLDKRDCINLPFTHSLYIRTARLGACSSLRESIRRSLIKINCRLQRSV